MRTRSGTGASDCGGQRVRWGVCEGVLQRGRWSERTESGFRVERTWESGLRLQLWCGRAVGASKSDDVSVGEGAKGVREHGERWGCESC